MDDAQMLDWLQFHATGLRLQNEDAFRGPTYALEWLDYDGMPRETTGSSLRDCVRGAAAIAQEMTDAKG